MTPVLRFCWLDDDDGEQNDEVCTVTLDGRPVITMDHGPHGWDGMVGIRDALLACAEIHHWTVETEGESGI